MKWFIPAKTFLVGEYVALTGGSALILTTSPYFEVSLTDKEKDSRIHPLSPAGIWWNKTQIKGKFLNWKDPYNACGGLGASSAQFLGSYWASCYLQHHTPEESAMLEAYYQSAWSGKGLRPSGYDVIAQARKGCVFINRQDNLVQSYLWPFADLSFLIVHTGVKLATHQHLLNTALPGSINELSGIVNDAKQAFEQKDDDRLIHAINAYHHTLDYCNLVAEHTAHIINALKSFPEILAIKGCGALGSDTLLLLTKQQNRDILKQAIELKGLQVLATEANLTC